MLNMLLPKMLPAAKSGTCWLMELMVVNNSGIEVAPASNRVPMNMPPSLLRTAITSPYSANLMATVTIKTALTRN